MDKSFFKGKKVTVFGLGIHGGGIGAVRFLAAHGAKIIVTDIKKKEELVASLEKLKDIKNVEYILGQHRTEDFTKVDLVIKTPPAPWNGKHIKLALDSKVPVEMDAGLFFKLCKNPIIGVTGTKGKTTTSLIIAEILKVAGKNLLKVGIGQTSVLDKVDLVKSDSVPVFELSSWRLSALGRAKISPHIAVFKNIYPDHLNYYQTMENYIRDKKNIFLYQSVKDWLIINEDDEVVRQFAAEAKSQIVKFSLKPVRDGRAVYLEDEAIYLNDGNDAKKVADLSELKIKGVHNYSSALAAIGAAWAFGIAREDIRKAVINFQGVPHRLELAGEVRGVKYYNDTAATIPEAVISALEAFTQPIILIAGGSDKSLDFEKLGKIIAEQVKGVILLPGSATEKLREQINKNLTVAQQQKGFFVADSMAKAVEAAAQAAETGDVVLLSPGAASFGLFANEFDRGDKFKSAVGKLK